MKELVAKWEEYVQYLMDNLKENELWLKQNDNPDLVRSQIIQVKGGFAGFMEWLVKESK